MKYFSHTILIIAFALLPYTVNAIDVGLPFGGYVGASIPCTCSTGFWIYYPLLYAGSEVPITGALYFPLGAVLYPYYQVGVPTTWELGSYAPGVSACFVFAANPIDPCIFIPAMGTIEYMGTSMPGAII
ncbi:MAG: hypothetical protein JWL80_180 [Parcubacteria group bacterium]|nr:hypothetical protein [Parcubacteria group bacterium]